MGYYRKTAKPKPRRDRQNFAKLSKKLDQQETSCHPNPSAENINVLETLKAEYNHLYDYITRGCNNTFEGTMVQKFSKTQQNKENIRNSPKEQWKFIFKSKTYFR